MLAMDSVEIFWVDEGSDAAIETVRSLFREYATSLNIDLCFQDFESELGTLPGAYSAPRGALALALCDGEPAGCCALRAIDSTDYANACEMKRLYVRPGKRGSGVGRRLVESILEQGRVLGYDSVLLDTLSDMEAARGLYEDLGFVEIPPYYFNPIPGAHYLMAEL